MKRLLIVILVLVCSCSFAQIRGGAQYDPAAARRDLSNVSGAASLELSQRVRAAWAEITGNIYASGSARLEAGTAAAPAYSFASDPNTGIYSAGADTLGFAEGGAEAFRVNSGGETLIATSTDSGDYKLQVSGSGLFVDSTFDKHLVLRRGTNDGHLSPTTSPDNGLWIWAGSDYTKGIKTFASGTFLINDGPVLIATTTELLGFKLNLVGKSAFSDEVLIATSTDAGDYKLQVAGSARFQGSLTATGITNEYFIAAGASKTLSEAVGVVKRARLEITSCVNYYGMADYWIADDFTVTLISQQGSHFASTDTATSICIFNDSGTIKIKNNKASSIYLNINYSGLK